jgi:hypothetical protein
MNEEIPQSIWCTEPWLREQILVHKKSLGEIAQVVNRSPATVTFHIHKFGLPLPNQLKSRELADHDRMFQLYALEGKSVLEIARLLHCRNDRVVQALKDLEIFPRRSICTEEWITEQYVTLERDILDIAEELQCTEMNIRYYLRKFKIPIRYKSTGKINVPLLANSDWLYKTYIVENRTLEEMSVLTQASIPSIWKRLAKAGIFKRPNIVNKAVYYQIGQQFPSDIRDAILQRDKYACRMPDCDSSSEKISIHHIIPQKENGEDSVTNGITLCRKCHYRTYGKEDQFAELFISLIQESPA